MAEVVAETAEAALESLDWDLKCRGKFLDFRRDNGDAIYCSRVADWMAVYGCGLSSTACDPCRAEIAEMGHVRCGRVRDHVHLMPDIVWRRL